MQTKLKCKHEWYIRKDEFELMDKHGIYRLRRCRNCDETEKVYPYLLNQIFYLPKEKVV